MPSYDEDENNSNDEFNFEEMTAEQVNEKLSKLF
ncbi:hypothetical protein B0I22_1579 [Epilithonimonas xixisoli]|uniref:Uncharacterized protein n=1 Tax=Epilithonimonas xixisoli TaxID=1476462 RepID=A0A4R8I9R1_9FLAO|nr:hypothetical protein B0I22_1579 [Epilithonimonas xixisoli]